MRKRGKWVPAAVLSLGLASFAVGGEEPEKKPAATQSWWGRLFSRPTAQAELTVLVDEQEAKATRNLEEVKAREERQQAVAQRARDSIAVLQNRSELAQIGKAQSAG